MSAHIYLIILLTLSISCSDSGLNKISTLSKASLGSDDPGLLLTESEQVVLAEYDAAFDESEGLQLFDSSNKKRRSKGKGKFGTLWKSGGRNSVIKALATNKSKSPGKAIAKVAKGVQFALGKTQKKIDPELGKMIGQTSMNAVNIFARSSGNTASILQDSFKASDPKMLSHFTSQLSNIKGFTKDQFLDLNKSVNNYFMQKSVKSGKNVGELATILGAAMQSAKLPGISAKEMATVVNQAASEFTLDFHEQVKDLKEGQELLQEVTANLMDTIAKFDPTDALLKRLEDMERRLAINEVAVQHIVDIKYDKINMWKRLPEELHLNQEGRALYVVGAQKRAFPKGTKFEFTIEELDLMHIFPADPETMPGWDGMKGGGAEWHDIEEDSSSWANKKHLDKMLKYKTTSAKEPLDKKLARGKIANKKMRKGAPGIANKKIGTSHVVTMPTIKPWNNCGTPFGHTKNLEIFESLKEITWKIPKGYGHRILHVKATMPNDQPMDTKGSPFNKIRMHNVKTICDTIELESSSDITPPDITPPEPPTVPVGNITHMALGHKSACVVANRKLLCWGEGSINDIKLSSTPQYITGFNNVEDLHGNSNMMCVVNNQRLSCIFQATNVNHFADSTTPEHFQAINMSDSELPVLSVKVGNSAVCVGMGKIGEELRCLPTWTDIRASAELAAWLPEIEIAIKERSPHLLPNLLAETGQLIQMDNKSRLILAMVRLKSGKVQAFAWGQNRDNRLGVGDRKENRILRPLPIVYASGNTPSSTPVKVSNSIRNSCILHSSGVLYCTDSAKAPVFHHVAENVAAFEITPLGYIAFHRDGTTTSSVSVPSMYDFAKESRDFEYFTRLYLGNSLCSFHGSRIKCYNNGSDIPELDGSDQYSAYRGTSKFEYDFGGLSTTGRDGPSTSPGFEGPTMDPISGDAEPPPLDPHYDMGIGPEKCHGLQMDGGYKMNGKDRNIGRNMFFTQTQCEDVLDGKTASVKEVKIGECLIPAQKRSFSWDCRAPKAIKHRRPWKTLAPIDALTPLPDSSLENRYKCSGIYTDAGDARVMFFSKDQCDNLGGEFYPQKTIKVFECLVKGGGSYSYECSIRCSASGVCGQSPRGPEASRFNPF